MATSNLVMVVVLAGGATERKVAAKVRDRGHLETQIVPGSM